MAYYTDEEYFEFFLEQFRHKKKGIFCGVMIYPFRGEAYATDKNPDELKTGEDIVYVYELNRKEKNFFYKHKEYCNHWIILKKELTNGR